MSSADERFAAGRLPSGLTVTLYPEAATWGSLRQLLRYADAMDVSDDTELGCVYNEQNELEGITLGPGNAS